MPDTLNLVPTATGPVPSDDTSHQFNNMLTYPEPLDPAEFGYVEQEWFVSGEASVYGDDGQPTGVLPYCNRLIVRRPVDAATASGVVFVDLLNPSNGYDAEGLWRRGWNYYLTGGHTYLGVTTKPVTIDALKTFDPTRYAPLGWEADPDHPHDPVGPDFHPLDVVLGAQEGLVWDIITQTGRLLRAPGAGGVLGEIEPGLVVLMGQSQSAHLLNAWIRAFHGRVKAEAAPLWDAYLVTVGSRIERPLTQQPMQGGVYATIAPGDDAPVDVPTIMVTAEGDVGLYGGVGHPFVAQTGIGDGPWRRHYCVAGTPHTELSSRVMPNDEEVLRAGRRPRVMTPQARAAGSIFPLGPAVVASLDLLVAWARDGVEPPASVWFQTARDGRSLLRDADGNVRGGVRYGLIERPLASFTGSPTGGTLGGMELFDAARVLAQYPTLGDYLAAVASVDDGLAARGFLTETGRHEMAAAATELWTRATSTGGETR